MSAPPSAAEALSSLLWQPYDCRSPPPRPRPRTAVWHTGLLPGARAQSPSGGRHARSSVIFHDMRLPVPAPVRKSDSVSVRVPGEPSQCNVNIVQVPSPNVNSAVQTERERSVASAECQTEEPRRRRARRGRAPRAPELESVPPPPYSTLPPLHVPVPMPVPVPVPVSPPAPAPLVTHPPAPRFPFQPVPLRSGRGAAYACSEADGNAPKSCCGRPPLRLCVLFLGVVGACLVAAGATLGALRPHPTPLTLILLMIGIGVVLVTAAGLAWRLAARDAPCALFGLRRASCRRLVPRLPPSYARPHHPYAAMLYPEFHYRPPPPTYQASMQEYRLRLLLDRSAPVVSPPPTYRSNSASLVRGTTGAWCVSEYSGPPSYRAPRADPPLAAPDSLPISPNDLKYSSDTIDPLPKPTEQEKEDEHLVTIVHTDAQPVIVTVSGSPALNDSHPAPSSEIDILAHL